MTYNQVGYIDECLESVLSQVAGIPAEIIVGDDASTDGTSERIASISSRHASVLHLRHPVRGGAAANIQAVLREARGYYIARLDGDDFWMPGKLAKQVAFLDANPDCAAVYTAALLIDELGRHRGRFSDVREQRLTLEDLVRRGNLLNTSSMVFRRTGVPEWLALEGEFLDYQGHLMEARRGWIHHFSEPLTAYRVGAVGSMVAEANDTVREMYWRAILSVQPGSVTDRARLIGMADFLRRVAFRAVARGTPGLFVRWWRRVVRHAPGPPLMLAAQVLVEVVQASLRESGGLIRRAVVDSHERVLYRGRS